MKNNMSKKLISILLSICILFSIVSGMIFSDAETNNFYHYIEDYSDASKFTGNMVSQGFSVTDGTLSLNPTTAGGENRAIVISDGESYVWQNKTYRVAFDLTIKNRPNTAVSDKLEIKGLQGDAKNVWSTIVSTPLASIPVCGSSAELNATTRYNLTITMPANTYWMIFRYEGDSRNNVYTEFYIDNLQIDEVIPVTATSEDSAKGTAFVTNKNTEVQDFVLGETAVFTATACEGYEFDGWYNGNTKIEGAEATYETKISGEVNIVAKFRETNTSNSTFYQYKEDYSNATKFTGNMVSQGFSVKDGTLSLNPTTAGGENRAIVISDGESYVWENKTYRVAFDLTITNRPDTSVSDKLEIKGLQGDARNVWSTIVSTPLASLPVYGSSAELNATTRYNLTITMPANTYWLIFRYEGDSKNGVYTEFNIDNLQIDEVIPVTAISEDDAKGTVSVINKNTSVQDFVFGDTAVFTAVAEDGYQFEGWYNGDTKIEEAEESYEILVNEVVNLTAKFKGVSSKYYSYNENYSDVSKFTSGMVSQGFSVTDGTLSLNPTTAGGENRAIVISDGESYVWQNKTYRVAFDLTIKNRPNTAVSDKLEIKGLQGDAKNVWSTIVSTPLASIPVCGSSAELNATTRYNLTITMPANTYWMIFRYEGDSKNGVYTEFNIDNLQIDEVIPVTATSEDEAKGTVRIDNKNAKVADFIYGETAVFTATAVEGYEFDGWYNGDTKIEGAESTYEIRIKDAIELTAKFNGNPITPPSTPSGIMKFGYEDGEGNYAYTDPDASSVSRDANKVHSGKYAHKRTYSKGITDCFHLTPCTSAYMLTQGKSYSVSVWVYKENGGAAALYVSTTPANNSWHTHQGAVDYLGDANKWNKITYVFTASTTGYLTAYLETGDLASGDDVREFYFDDITITEVDKSEITFESNGGSAVENMLGIVGAPISLPQPTTAPEGKRFDGWYYDETLTNHAVFSSFPEENITLYAKWVSSKEFAQSFEDYHYTINSSSGWEIYTKQNSNDDNVVEGNKAIYRDGSQPDTKPIFLNDRYSNLNIGSYYKMTFKIKVSDIEKGLIATLGFIAPPDKNNIWSYTANFSKYYSSISYYSIGDVDKGWQEVTHYFAAESQYFGLVSANNFSYYIDDVELLEVPVVTVSFETNGGAQMQPVKGAAGAALNVEKPIPPEGKSFAGWYTDREFLNAYQITVFPESDLVLYAKYIKAGTFEQDFEHWTYKENSTAMSTPFSYYTAKNSNDTNVYSGTHSLYYESLNDSSTTYSFTVFDKTMDYLQIGEKYKLTMRFKPIKSAEDEWSSGPYLRIYNTTQAENAWSYIMGQNQGPLVNFSSFIFYNDKFDDSRYSGTNQAFKTTEQKDKNGWITMEFEFTAMQHYIAFYTTGAYSAYFDAITIEPLPSGVIETDYTSPYCEDFYNIIPGVKADLNSENKRISELKLDVRGDYIFTVSLKKGNTCSPKVYLAWDKEGNNVIESSLIEGKNSNYKLSSVRFITDMSGIVYLVTEGGGKNSCEYALLFKSQFGKAEDPNPIYTYEKVNYNKLPEKSFANGMGEELSSPSTGDDNRIVVCFMLFVITMLTALFTIRKKGEN